MRENMKCLGIESTAHTFGCGIVDSKCNVFSNEKDAFKPEQGGILPREAADHHYAAAKTAIQNALEKAHCSIKDIDLIAFSQGPGIGNCLKVGATAARTLALLNNIPILGVNHCVGHIEIGLAKTKAKDPVIVYASGANTQIMAFENGKYRIFGETIDIGIGNLLDSFGRDLNIGFPAGPTLDSWYFENNKYIELPYTVKGSDLAFSGLLTAAKNKLLDKNNSAKDVSYSLLHNAFAMLTEVTERVIAHTEKKEVLLTGGVAASRALREMLADMCESRGAKLYVPETQFCTDNAAMIAWLGIIMHRAGNRMHMKETQILPNQRADDIKVNWR